MLLLSGVAFCGAELDGANPLETRTGPETDGVQFRTLGSLSQILPSLYNLGRYQPSYGYVYGRPSYVNPSTYSNLNRPVTPYVITLQQPIPYVYNRPGVSTYSTSSGSPLFSGYSNNGYYVYPYGYGLGFRQSGAANQDVSTTVSVEPITSDAVKF